MRSTLFLLALSFALVANAEEPEPPAAVQLEPGNGVMQAWSVVYGGYVGGTAGYLVGESLEESESDHIAQGIAPGALAGTAIGATTGALMLRQQEVTLDQSVYTWSSSALGGFYGAQIGRAFIPIDADGSVERVHAAALAGSMAGTGVGLLGRAPDFRNTLHLDLATGIGSLAGAGLSDAAGLTLADERQVRAGINLGSSAAFGTIAAVHGAVGAEQPNAAAWGLSLSQGAWIGGWSPYLFTNTPNEQQVFGGMRAGVGVGYAGALALASAGNVDNRSAALQSVGIASGNALGAGIPLALGYDGTSRTVVAPMLASGIAGQALGAVVAPHYDLTPNDAFLLGTLGAWTGFQSIGWSAWALSTEDSGSRALGYALTTGGGGTLLAMGLAPALDVPASGSAMLLASGGWGSWYGGWSAELLDVGTDDGWVVLLTSGDAAIAGTAIAHAAGWNPTWRDVGLVNGTGLLGAAGGGLIGVVALYDEDDWDPMVGSILVGSTIGLGAGAVLAARSPDRDAARRDLPELKLGKGIWQPNVSARPWMSEDGDPGVYGEVSLTELARNRDR